MTKEQETRIRVLGALAALFMVCATVAGICIDADKWAKFGRWLTDPATAVAFSALGGGLLALYLRAKASPAAGLLLALVVAGTLQGCTAAQWQDTLHVLKPLSKWTCSIANALCLKGGDDVACAVIATACGIVEPLLEGEEEGRGPLDPDREDGVISEEP